MSSMIICHCTHISDHDIRAAINWMRKADPQTIITPGKIYHALGKTADCGGCMPLFLDTMRSSSKLEVPAQLANLREATHREKDHAGRPQGHRLSQQGAAP
ncbi:(2Fe-2S)-binding protein [Nocardioides marinus]|nr:(2Fe-2S)-binding protein [Nocardioides marinus]